MNIKSLQELSHWEIPLGGNYWFFPFFMSSFTYNFSTQMIFLRDRLLFWVLCTVIFHRHSLYFSYSSQYGFCWCLGLGWSQGHLQRPCGSDSAGIGLEYFSETACMTSSTMGLQKTTMLILFIKVMIPFWFQLLPKSVPILHQNHSRQLGMNWSLLARGVLREKIYLKGSSWYQQLW